MSVRRSDSVWTALRFGRVLQEQDGSGIVVLRDGGYAAALAVFPPNYVMLSEEAVDALLDYALRPALNRIHFPFAVIVRARRPDLSAWLEERRQRRAYEETVAMLLRLGVELDTLLHTEARTRDIVEREMAVVVPYTPEGKVTVQFFGKRRNRQAETQVVPEEVQRKLASRCQELEDVLRRIGCTVLRMGVLELLAWFYEVYNPDRAQCQPLETKSIVGLMAPIRTLAQARMTEEQHG